MNLTKEAVDPRVVAVTAVGTLKLHNGHVKVEQTHVRGVAARIAYLSNKEQVHRRPQPTSSKNAPKRRHGHAKDNPEVDVVEPFVGHACSLSLQNLVLCLGLLLLGMRRFGGDEARLYLSPAEKGEGVGHDDHGEVNCFSREDACCVRTNIKNGPWPCYGCPLHSLCVCTLCTPCTHSIA